MAAVKPQDESLLDGWLRRLESLSPHEIDMGLDRVARVLDRLGSVPAASVLHVGGTNGKGSCVAMLESLMLAGGLRVGAYTSPHLIRYNERIRIDGSEADDETIVDAFERVESVRGDECLTYFEYGTLAAISVFAEAGVDVAILEVGMGGRLDAVNAVEPTAGLITNVTLDHCAWLGKDVETIAIEKAGIMRPGKPVVVGSREAPAALSARADAIGADLRAAGRDYDYVTDDDRWHWRGTRSKLDDLPLPSLPGEHQLANAAAVLALLEAAGFGDLLRPALVGAALGRVRLAGRMQRLDDGRAWLLDVAHNPAGAAILASALRAAPSAGRTVAVIGVLDDKDVAGILAPLDDAVDEWIAVTADSRRAVPAAELGRQVEDHTGKACLAADSISAAMDHARAITGRADRIVVTGSFTVVGPALATLYSQPTS